MIVAGHKNNYFLGKDQRQTYFHQEFWVGWGHFSKVLLFLYQMEIFILASNTNKRKERETYDVPAMDILYPFLTSLQFYGWILCQPVVSGGRILMIEMLEHLTEAIFMFFKVEY